MKKRLTITTLLLIIGGLLISGCSHKTYTEIDYNTYKEMVDNKDSFVLFIGSSECSHCADYKVTLDKIIKKYDLDVKYIDLASMEDADYNEFKSKVSFSGTPTTIFVKKGKEINHYNRIVGAKDYDYIVDKFKKNGYIKED